MPQNYTPEYKKKIVRLREEEGRTYKSITAEYGVSKARFPSGAANSAKNAKQKPSKVPTQEMKWSL